MGPSPIVHLFPPITPPNRQDYIDARDGGVEPLRPYVHFGHRFADWLLPGFDHR